MFFNITGGAEARSNSLENPAISLNDSEAWNAHFGTNTVTGETITEEKALGVPAIFQAVNCISGTLAHLPFHLYTSNENGAEKATKDPLYKIIHDRVNDVHTSLMWRKWLVTRLLIDGRALSLILRNGAGKVMGLIPLEVSKTIIKQGLTSSGTLERTYTVGGKRYRSTDVLDFVWLPKADGVGHYSPITLNRNSISLMIAAEKYAANLLASGGVPPLVLTGNTSSPASQERATNDINKALRSARDTQRAVLNIPGGYELKDLGFDPQKQQLIELRRHQIGEVSRIFNVAPAMLHDLSTGTYSNVEQQSLSFVQVTLAPLIQLIEQEMNAKLFGARNTSNYVEFNLDGFQRGDFTSRMNGLARAVQTALLTPNEARGLDNRAPLPGGDELLIQGATVPISMAGKVAAPEPEPASVDQEPVEGDDQLNI
jgi:HK97 family phage portal protein